MREVIVEPGEQSAAASAEWATSPECAVRAGRVTTDEPAGFLPGERETRRPDLEWLLAEMTDRKT